MTDEQNLFINLQTVYGNKTGKFGVSAIHKY